MRRFPDSLVLIFALILLAQVAGWVLPAGEFERDGRRVVPGTYQVVDAEPLPPLAFLTAIPAGLGAAQEIIFFVFLVGGVIGVVRATGAIDAAIGAAITRLGSRPVWLVGGAVGLFALGASTVGMAEEYMPFVPILVTMCLALRLDAVVAVGIIYVGAGVGYACAAFNPFTVLIAQDIAGVTLTSGQAPRWVLLMVCGAVGVHHILRYAARIRADPEASLVRSVDYSNGFTLPEDQRFTARRWAVLVVLAGGIGLFVWGVAARGWYLSELSAVFLAIGLIAAAVAGVAPKPGGPFVSRRRGGNDGDGASDRFRAHDRGGVVRRAGNRHYRPTAWRNRWPHFRRTPPRSACWPCRRRQTCSFRPARARPT